MLNPCREYLTEYIESGIPLIPLARIKCPDGKDRVLPNVPKGSHVLNEAGNGLNPEFALDSKEKLEQYIMAHDAITMMGFYPKYSRYLVLDLDNSPAHANEANGIENFVAMVGGLNLASNWQRMFADFPNNFPCYVRTRHNGLHLYFKADFIPDEWKPDSTELNKKNIEIKYNTQATAAGSIRDGFTYEMEGYLADAPEITLGLITAMTKAPPKPFNTLRHYKANDGEPKAKWNQTADGIIAKARELHGANAHETIMWMAKYFAMAGWDRDEALAEIENTAEHANRKDKHDTKTCVYSFFK